MSMRGNRLLWAVVSAVAVGVLLSGCKAQTDLGKPCILVKKDPNDTDPSNGIQSIPIKESEITPGKDFVSFGATDCEDLVCVRDANTPAGDPNADATGFCSRSCVQTIPDSCDTGDDTIDKAKTYTCRSLILDEETLAAIKQNDPEKYRKYFGDTQSPYFCAKPQTDSNSGT